MALIWPVMKSMPVSTRKPPIAFSTVGRCRRKRLGPGEEERREAGGEQEGHAEAERIDEEQEGAARRRVLGAGHRQDRAEDRADAGRPAEGEGEAEHVAAEEAGRLARHLQARLAVEEGDAENAEEMQAHRRDDEPGDEAHERDVGAEDSDI